MEVEDGLSGTGADVEDGAVALLDVALAGDVGGSQMAAADEFGVGGLSFLQSRKMFLGNDENVCRRMGMNVFESEHMIVFINFLGWNLTADDTAEEAVWIGHSWFTGDGLPC